MHDVVLINCFLIFFFYFREAEDKLEQSQKIAMEKEYVLQKFKEEYKQMKHDLIEQNKQGKR